MLHRFGVSDRWSRVFNAAVIIFALIGMVQLVMWMDRSVPITVHSRTIITPVVRPGGEFRYINYFTRTKFCETVVQRWLIDHRGQVHPIAPVMAAMPTTALNVRQESEARIPVPSDMPAGQAWNVFQSTWKCNPLQRLWPVKGPVTRIPFVVAGDPVEARLMFQSDPIALTAPVWEDD
jgi:hypothetical protein